MLASTFGQFACFLIISILLHYSNVSPQSKEYASASVSFFFLYFGSFGIGMLGIPWLYPTEINSLPMRTKGAAVATAMDWLVNPFVVLFFLLPLEIVFLTSRRITNFVVVEVTPIGIQNLGWKFWLVWTATNAAFLPILYFFYPETGTFAFLFNGK